MEGLKSMPMFLLHIAPHGINFREDLKLVQLVGLIETFALFVIVK